MTPGGVRWFAFCRSFVYNVFFRFSGGLEVIGKENIPENGPLIVAPLHVSHLDSMAVACGMKHPVQPMAKEELFKGIFGKLIRSLGAFPVKRGENDPEAIRSAIAVIERNEVVLLFPEGTRGDGVTMLPINRGVAMLAKRTNAPVMPIGLVGTFDRWPRGSSKVKRGRVKVVYGKPFTYSEVATAGNEKANRELFSRILGERIAELCNQHGYGILPPPQNAKPEPATADQTS